MGDHSEQRLENILRTHPAPIEVRAHDFPDGYHLSACQHEASSKLRTLPEPDAIPGVDCRVARAKGWLYPFSTFDIARCAPEIMPEEADPIGTKGLSDAVNALRPVAFANRGRIHQISQRLEIDSTRHPSSPQGEQEQEAESQISERSSMNRKHIHLNCSYIAPHFPASN
jgi:hypothetical protein